MDQERFWTSHDGHLDATLVSLDSPGPALPLALKEEREPNTTTRKTWHRRWERALTHPDCDLDNGCPRFVSLLFLLSYKQSLISDFVSLLPKPINAPVVSDDDDDVVVPVQPQQQAGPSQAVVIRQVVPPYGQRGGWKPAALEDFGA